MTTVDRVACDPRLGARDFWHRSDGRVEVRAGVRLTPATLVHLASVCYALRQAGHDPVFRANDAAVHDYLWRCAFLTVVRPVATIEPPVSLVMALPGDQRPQPSPLLLDVTRLETSAAIPALLDRILGILRQRLHYRPADAGDMTTAVSELCQNIFDHNASPDGFLAMAVGGRADRGTLEIAVADDGVGLAATLRRNPHHPPLASDHEAIQLAVQCGTSAYPDPMRGTGLYHLLELVAKQAGAVEIRSGTASVQYRPESRRVWTGAVPWVPGVHVTLTLPTPLRG
jgi:anti-sigma regulatory factor (Ser/Thr protein kinase)